MWSKSILTNHFSKNYILWNLGLSTTIFSLMKGKIIYEHLYAKYQPFSVFIYPIILETIFYQGFFMRYFYEYPETGTVVTALIQQFLLSKYCFFTFLHTLLDNIGLKNRSFFEFFLEKIFTYGIIWVLVQLSI